MHALQPLARDQGLRRRHKRARLQRLGQKVLVDRLADRVVLDRGPKHGFHRHAVRGIREAAFGSRDELAPARSVHDVDADAPGGTADAIQGSGDGLAVEELAQVLANGGVAVVVRRARAELLHVLEVFAGGGGDDFVAGRDGELDGVATHARGATPHEERLAGRFLRGDGGELQVEKTVLEESRRSGRQAERDDGRAFKGDAVRDLTGHVGLHGRVCLEGIVLGLLGGHADAVAEHAGAFLEPRDIGADGDDLAGNVLAEDGGIVEGEKGQGLQAAVDGVDGDGVIADENLIFLGGPKRSGFDLERFASGSCDPGRGVGSRHGVRTFCLVCGFQEGGVPDCRC